MIYGYARVSTAGQKSDGQVTELKAAGCEKVVVEIASGARRDRPRLARLLKGLAAGDVLMVTRLDRLARSSLDLLSTLHVVSEKGAAFRSIRDHWADTASAHGRLLMAVLAGLAEFERELMMARTSEGRDAAKVRGVKFGRKPSLSPQQAAWAAIQLRDDIMTGRQLAELLDVSTSTISRLPPAKPDAEAPEWSPGAETD